MENGYRIIHSVKVLNVSLKIVRDYHEAPSRLAMPVSRLEGLKKIPCSSKVADCVMDKSGIKSSVKIQITHISLQMFAFGI
jgi:hypothetical protein